jgi:VIT1/CCC1 family predicted Fe2+/Mn2+ transporter
MRESLRTGLAFGMTSGVITTAGLMVGLHSGTGSKLAVMGGILTIAIADAFSDALGIHISEESENRHTQRQIWASTVSTFASKFLLALSFLVPVLFLPLSVAVIVSIAWCMIVLAVMSMLIGRGQGSSTLRVVLEHIFIASVVILATHYCGHLIAGMFRG